MLSNKCSNSKRDKSLLLCFIAISFMTISTSTMAYKDLLYTHLNDSGFTLRFMRSALHVYAQKATAGASYSPRWDTAKKKKKKSKYVLIIMLSLPTGILPLCFLPSMVIPLHLFPRLIVQCKVTCLDH